MTEQMRRFFERFIKTNPRTAAIGIAGAATLLARMYPEQAARLGPIGSHESLDAIVALLVMLQGIFGGDAKAQIPASEVEPHTKVSVSGGKSDAG